MRLLRFLAVFLPEPLALRFFPPDFDPEARLDAVVAEARLRAAGFDGLRAFAELLAAAAFFFAGAFFAGFRRALFSLAPLSPRPTKFAIREMIPCLAVFLLDFAFGFFGTGLPCLRAFSAAMR